ncbi:hypothetical protein [Streptomyces sp. NPDC097619]|uniref:hypothetical protein n=1 Tax=Streptomyces sp. NPDC097619 TaxID=3157228 RepID=UPI00331725CB
MTARVLLRPSSAPARTPAVSGSGAARAASFAVLATALAAAGNHLAFAGTLTATALLIAVPALFALALPRARRARSLRTDLAVMVLAQAAASWWFGHLGEDPTDPAGAGHDGPRALLYCALTLLVGWTLHTADLALSRIGSAVQERLGSLAPGLRRLLARCPAPWGTRDPRPAPGPRRRHRTGRGPAPHEVILADTVIRRGPPKPLPRTVPEPTPVPGPPSRSTPFRPSPTPSTSPSPSLRRRPLSPARATPGAAAAAGS